MAASSFITRQYLSENFVESCGAVCFDLSVATEKKVCLIHYPKKGEWLLAKGRRDQGESRKNAALREVLEETGYSCHLLPVTMATRATPKDGPANLRDVPRVYPNLTDPFMFTLREIDGGSSVKVIWWYIASLDGNPSASRLPGEDNFSAEFFPCEEAIEKLTFQSDREVLRRAMTLVEESTA
ncbi:NUDIX hydrolase domain-like protein [Clohesyomyces aquaticus]|uniref:NUDIX hydrolase domain-like protein n=1 Tax=Clohesyomyces aquaticus TaxID=1231657 RepID=A0A1Y1ZU19_9PLEO|nr:NUDIX hydrolase domain-like protein [Clohesyomyces aquaticus]